jgi:hypothetical protein
MSCNADYPTYLLGTGHARAKRSALQCEISGVDLRQPRGGFLSGGYEKSINKGQLSKLVFY